MQTHAERDNAVDGIDAQRREKVPVRFAARRIGEHTQAERVGSRDEAALLPDRNLIFDAFVFI